MAALFPDVHIILCFLLSGCEESLLYVVGDGKVVGHGWSKSPDGTSEAGECE
jgi:hypothetical protein